MDRSSPEKTTGSFALAIGVTSLVILVPCLAAVGLRGSGLVTSPVLLIMIPVLVSIGFSHGIAEFWKRRRTGSPLLFEDLMVWGWFRRRRFEKLLSRSEQFVGPDAGRGLAPRQRAKELERLADALEARDPRTHGHSRRVARHSTSIARELKLPEQEVARIRTAALLHDIGKIRTPWEILEKPGALTDAEYAEVKRHSAEGARLVASMDDPSLTAIVRNHHERIDGGGYPDGLAGDEIPVGARIIAVADTFDALTSARSYRRPRSHEQALGILREEAGRQLDAEAVGIFDDRYASRRPVALVAAVVGLGRQAGQSMIGFGTGASQVAAVGAAAAVIGTGPAVDIDRPQRGPETPAIVREAGPGAPSASDPGATPAPEEIEASSRAGVSSRVRKQVRVSAGRTRIDRVAKGRSSGKPDGNGVDSNQPDREGGNATDDENGGGGNVSGGSSGGDGSDPSGASGSGGSSDSGGSTKRPNPVGETVKGVTETLQKPVRQVTETVTDAIPALPGKDPVSQTVNKTVDGVKGVLGKLTGKP